MPMALGLIALLVVSVGGAIFLSTRPDYVPGQLEADAQPSPVMSPEAVRLLAMANYLEQRQQPPQLARASEPAPVPNGGGAAAAVDVGQDIEVLISLSSQSDANGPSLEEIQSRMRASPHQYFEALQASFPSIPTEAFQARLSGAQWLVSLAQMTGRQADAEPILRKQFENANSEAESVAYRSLLATLGFPAPERAPADQPVPAATEGDAPPPPVTTEPVLMDAPASENPNSL